MTTIVYDHKTGLIACDSRLTQGGFIASDESIKYKTTDQGVWFFSGNAGESDIFIEKFNLLSIAPDNLNVTAIFASKDRIFVRSIDNDRVFRECELTFTDGIGSGCEHAIAALDAGADLVDAMKIAANRDCYTGGDIRVYSISEEKFL